MSGLKFLYNLILKDTVKGSGQASGILSIGKDIRKLADKKFQRYVMTAQKQGVDLDKLSEQEIKYMLELNKPKAPQVLSNEDAYAFLNKFSLIIISPKSTLLLFGICIIPSLLVFMSCFMM